MSDFANLIERGKDPAGRDVGARLQQRCPHNPQRHLPVSRCFGSLFAKSSMSLEPERRKSKKSTFLYLQVSHRLNKTRKSLRPFSVVCPSITRRSVANALMACSALLLFQGTSSRSRNVNIVLRFFCKRSMILLAASPIPNSVLRRL